MASGAPSTFEGGMSVQRSAQTLDRSSFKETRTVLQYFPLRLRDVVGDTSEPSPQA